MNKNIKNNFNNTDAKNFKINEWSDIFFVNFEKKIAPTK